MPGQPGYAAVWTDGTDHSDPDAGNSYSRNPRCLAAGVPDTVSYIPRGGSIYSGRFVPQLLQNFPVFCVPHEGHTQGPAGAGLAVPQLLQNFPVFCVPHEGHTQAPAGEACAGAGACAPG